MESENTKDQNTEGFIEEKLIVVDPEQAAIRLDVFVVSKLKQVSRAKVQRGIIDGAVTVNGRQVKSNYKINPGDRIDLKIPRSNPHIVLAPEKMDLDIRYEDDDIIILHKPPGLVMHPGIGNRSGTLVNGLMHHCQSLHLPYKGDRNTDRPGIVHRIDKDTSGLVVIAKTDQALSHLAKQFYDHTVQREYIALIWGEPPEDRGTIEGHIGRNPKNRLQMKVFPEGEEGKHAITHYEVLEGLYYVSLVRCHLETGRTHQIRVHFKHQGHPVFNDVTYHGNRIVKGTQFTKFKQFVFNCFSILPRQALHAKSLGFVHPGTGKEVFFDSEIPDDMTQVLEKWRHYLMYRKEHS